jgi:hypothetical protein
MIPVQWWNYLVLVASSLLIGLTAATYVRNRALDLRGGRRTAGGGVLSLFAIGCPVCNKLVVPRLRGERRATAVRADPAAARPGVARPGRVGAVGQARQRRGMFPPPAGSSGGSDAQQSVTAD